MPFYKVGPGAKSWRYTATAYIHTLMCMNRYALSHIFHPIRLRQGTRDFHVNAEGLLATDFIGQVAHHGFATPRGYPLPFTRRFE